MWVEGVPAGERGITAFMKAATWPDAIQERSTYTDDQDASSSEAHQNIGYSDMLQHRYWHFIDTPFSPDGTPLVNPVAPNALSRIRDFKKVLASPDAPDVLKSNDLVWLLHLVAEVHQPLHSATRFTKTQRSGDRGGRDVALCLVSHPCRGALHAFWDDVLGTSKSLAAARRTAASIARVTPPSGTETDESTWIRESVGAARTVVYVPPVGVGAGPFTLSARYRVVARVAAKERIAIAGARLAAVLNELLRSRPSRFGASRHPI